VGGRQALTFCRATIDNLESSLTMDNNTNDILDGYGKATQKIVVTTMPDKQGSFIPVVLVPLESVPREDRHTKDESDPRLMVLEDYQKYVKLQGIKGDVVIVWRNDDGTISYFPKSPPELRSFFRNLSWAAILANATTDLIYP
jgi:hypothetical protein